MMGTKTHYAVNNMGVYLDNSATSFPKPEAVYKAINDTLRNVGANPGRGGYKLSLEASRLVFKCREALADLFNIKNCDNIAFTANATEALNIGIKGVLEAGDEVITTPLEHNSVLRPLSSLEKSINIKVKYITCKEDGTFSAGDVKKLITGKTKLIVITHASNVIGTIAPVEETFNICKQFGIITMLDVAQTAGILPIDVEKMKIDIIAGAGHKSLFGPQGTGFIYVSDSVNLKTIKEGGTGTRSSELTQPTEMPEKLECGTLNTPGIAGLLAGVNFISDTGIENIRKHEILLGKKLVEGLLNNDKVILYGPKEPENRASALSFNIKKMDCSEVGFILDEIYDIYVRVGLHCAPLAHKLIGTFPSGTVRVSPGYFNTENDIEAFINAINEISKKV